MWAYKYDSELRGIGPHADSAAVNVNIWITESEASLTHGGAAASGKPGGLVIYRVGRWGPAARAHTWRRCVAANWTHAASIRDSVGHGWGGGGTAASRLAA